MTSRRVYPPWSYQCLYKDCCPHLEGLSTHWVWEEYQRSHDQYLEHWQICDRLQENLEKARRVIKELEEENEDLKIKLTALHRKQFQSNKKVSTAEPGNKSDGGKRKRGAPKGHPGWFRSEPRQIDKTVIVPAPERCPHCGCTELDFVKEVKDHIQEDIVFQPRPIVTRFIHHQGFCSKCKRPVITAAKGELVNCQIGPMTKAAAVFLRYGLRISYRKVQELFYVFFNMPFVPASAMAFDRSATRKGEPLYEDLKEKVRAAAVIHADETHWRKDGINHHLWYTGNDDLALFHVDRHRSSDVAKMLLGSCFDGVLHADGYAAYNAVDAQVRQTCLAHLMRTAKEIKQEILQRRARYRDKASIGFCDKIILLFKQACDIGQRLRRGSITHDEAGLYETQWYAILHDICSLKLSHKKAENLRQRLIDPKKEYHRLFTFLKHPNAQPTNNQAEQSLRNMVIFRKVCFGTRSDEGSRSHSVLPSLVVTAQRQGKHPLGFLQTLFTADTPTAQAALYNDSS